MAGFTRRDTVKGVSFFDGNIDGQQIRSGVLFIEEPLDTKKGTAKGFRTVEYKTEEPDLAKMLLSSFDFPLAADVSFDILTSKRGQSIVVTAVKPVAPIVHQPPTSKAA